MQCSGGTKVKQKKKTTILTNCQLKSALAGASMEVVERCSSSTMMVKVVVLILIFLLARPLGSSCLYLSYLYHACSLVPKEEKVIRKWKAPYIKLGYQKVVKLTA